MHLFSLKKADILLILVILILAVFSLLHWRAKNNTPAVFAEVTVGGEVYERFDLSKDYEGDIPGINGGTNHLVIKDGKVQVTQASCPDKICVNQGIIAFSWDQPIVCLPNQVTVQIVGGE